MVLLSGVALDARAQSSVHGAGLRYERDGVVIETVSIPIETPQENDIVSRGIAAEISKEWNPKISQLELVTVETPKDGIFPVPEEVRGVSPVSMMSQLKAHLKRPLISPHQQSVLKLSPKIGDLRWVHLPYGKGLWGYTVIRVSVNQLFTFWSVITSRNPATVFAPAIVAIGPMIGYAVNYKSHPTKSGAEHSEWLEDNFRVVKETLKVGEKNSTSQLLEKKLLERKVDQVKKIPTPIFFTENIFADSVYLLEKMVSEWETGEYKPLTLGTLLSSSIGSDPHPELQKVLEMNAALIRAYERPLSMLGSILSIPGFVALGESSIKLAVRKAAPIALYTFKATGVASTRPVSYGLEQTVRQIEADIRLNGRVVKEEAPFVIPHFRNSKSSMSIR